MSEASNRGEAFQARTTKDAGRLGNAFVEARGRRDLVRLEALLEPQIRFRALVPTGLRTAEDAATTVAFVGPRLHLDYRIRLREAGIW